MIEKVNKNCFTIFISHRYADKAIADVLKSAMSNWGNGQLRILQSSDVRGPDSKIGQSLTAAQKKVLPDTDIVILIYTVTDSDWYYCMWESGLATDSQKQGTRMIVFQFSHDKPTALENQMTVTLDDESIKQFVHSFHKDPAFFPGCKQAIASETDENTVENESNDLIKELQGTCLGKVLC